MSEFEDHFSSQTIDYATYRPHYPPELYAYLASLVSQHRLAWDVATGNGQAALGLAEHFERVVATDASSEQIAHAFAHERVDYRVQPAEEPDLEAHSVDLVTVATGVHWFDFDRFYAAVRRAAAPNGHPGGLDLPPAHHRTGGGCDFEAVYARNPDGLLAGTMALSQ